MNFLKLILASFLVANLSMANSSLDMPFPYFHCTVDESDGHKESVVLREREENGPLEVHLGGGYHLSFTAYEYQVFVELVRSNTDKTLFDTSLAAPPIPFKASEKYSTKFRFMNEAFDGLTNHVSVNCRGLDFSPKF